MPLFRSVPAATGQSEEIMKMVIMNSNPSNPEAFNLGIAGNM